MIKMKLFYIFSVLFIFLENCQQDNIIPYYKEIKVKKSDIVSSMRLSDIVSDVKYVVLDSTSPFQSRPDKIIVEDEYYYLLSKSKTKNIVKFSNTGHYLLKIESNTGPVLFNFIDDFLIDSNEIKILADTRLLSYDKTNFSYRYTKKLEYPAIGFEKNMSNNGYLFYLGFQSLDKRKLILYSDKKFNEIKKDIDAINREQIFIDNYFIKRERDILFFQPFYPVIYNLIDKNLSLKIVFEEGTIDKNELNGLIISNNISKYIDRNPSSPILSHYILGSYDYILFLYHINTKRFLSIYKFSLNLNRIILLNNFINDISFELGFPVVLAIDKEGYFYSYFESNSLIIDDKVLNNFQKSQYIIQLEELVKINPNSSILIKFKLKDELF